MLSDNNLINDIIWVNLKQLYFDIKKDKSKQVSSAKAGKNDLRFLYFLVYGLFLVLVLETASGCRAIPFYKRHAKATQSLVLSREGITAFEHKEYDSAEEKLKNAVELDETDIEVQRYYAETLWARQKYQEAFDILFQASQKKGTPDSEFLLNQSLGEKLLIFHRSTEAYQCAERMISLAPKKYEGWSIRANASWQMDRKEEALTDYQKALNFSPDNRDILWQLAHLQNVLGEHERALATWQHLGRLYQVNTEPPEVLYGKAESYYQLKRYQDSVENLELAIHLAPKEKMYYQLLSKVWLEKGNIQNAFLAAANAVECSPNDATSNELYRKIEEIRLANLQSPQSPQLR